MENIQWKMSLLGLYGEKQWIQSNGSRFYVTHPAIHLAFYKNSVGFATSAVNMRPPSSYWKTNKAALKGSLFDSLCLLISEDY